MSGELTRAYGGPVTPRGPRVFVQTGDARPKCVTPARLVRIRVNGEWWYTADEAAEQRAADRWWLVECENADVGRMLIGCCPLDDPRILASGGPAPAAGGREAT